jgi:hypothetical protein
VESSSQTSEAKPNRPHHLNTQSSAQLTSLQCSTLFQPGRSEYAGNGCIMPTVRKRNHWPKRRNAIRKYYQTSHVIVSAVLILRQQPMEKDMDSTFESLVSCVAFLCPLQLKSTEIFPRDSVRCVHLIFPLTITVLDCAIFPFFVGLSSLSIRTHRYAYVTATRVRLVPFS